VNNVVYVQWMQDVAVRHADAAGCTRATEALGATWVARSHKIEYLRPAFTGDRITARTWVADFRRVRSLRRYEFVRTSDEAVLAKGETDWVFVDTQSGRPRAIPEAIQRGFEPTP
jgi:acyl-CoA thioester hydrolase